MEAQPVFDLLLTLGPGGVVAAFFFYKWQQAEDRLEKTREAFDLKREEYHQSNLTLQRVGFENSLRVEGVLQNATQVIMQNTTTVQALIARGGDK